jgi:hypothetical protein
VRSGDGEEEPSTTTLPSGPGVTEICGDGIDNNAEGHIDEGCEATPPGEETPATPPLTNGGNTTQPGNATFVTINNAIAQAFSSTTYNTNVLRQAAQNALLVGEKTIPLQGTIASRDSRLLSTFDPFRLVGGSVIIHLPTSNIPSPKPIQILALDGDSNEMAILQSSKMPIGGNAYKIVLGAAFSGINAATGNQIIAFGSGSSVALLTIVR